MITEDYVSFETAKLLKDKGFCEPCFAYYSEYIDNWRTFKIWKKYPKTYDTVRNDGYVLVPTLQMAMKWLRKVHKIGVFPSTYTTIKGSDITHTYGTAIINLNTYGLMTLDSMDRETYEEACETAIKYCLENLI